MYNNFNQKVYYNYFLNSNRKEKEITRMSLIHNPPTYDEYFREFAFVTAKRSPCQYLQSGCVLVKNNRLVNQAHNTYIGDFFHHTHCTTISEMNSMFSRPDLEKMLINAEQNVLSDCARRGISCENTTIYCTHMPCITSVRLLIASGIKCIKYSIVYNENTMVPYMCKLSKVELVCISNI